MINVDFTKNNKQADYYITAMAAAQDANNYKILSYGGAIRGGKTFVSLALLARLCVIFPHSRWHVIREDFPKLEKTTIPSFNKIISRSNNWSVSRKSSNYHLINSESRL